MPRRAELERLAAPIVALAVLAVCSVLVSDQHFVRGEVHLVETVNAWPRWIGAPLEVVMQLGTLTAGVVAIAVVATSTLPRRIAPTVAVTIATIAAFRLDDVVKEVIERPRPYVVLPELTVRSSAGGFGFPSGHTTMAFALAAVLHPILPARVRWLPWVLATLVGLSRMYVGVHWPMDVVGGAALGIAIGSATSALMPTKYGRRRA